MAEQLTDAAKAAIADAVRIVKEDKWDRYLKDRIGKHSTTTPPVDPPNPKEGDPPTPPTPTDPPTDTPPKPKSAYWGVFEDD